MFQIINRIWHERRHGTPWRAISAERPSWAHGALYECDCGKRWLSRAPWDRVKGF